MEVRLLSRRIMQDLIKFPAKTPVKISEKAPSEKKPRKVINIAESERFKTARTRPTILQFRWNVGQWPFCVS